MAGESEKEYILSRQLEKIEHLFLWLSRCYYGEEIEAEHWKSAEIERLLVELERQYCERCPKKELCHRKIKRAFIQKGYLEQEDVVSYLTCHGGADLIQAANQMYQFGLQQIRMEQQRQIHQRFFVNQYRAAAQVIRDCMNQWEDQNEKELIVDQAIEKNARKYGIYVRDFYQKEQNGKLELYVYLRVKKGEKTAREIAGVFSRIFNKRLKPQMGCKSVVGNRFVWIELQEEVRFYTLSGGKRLSSKEEDVCGEQFTLENIREDCFAAVICDGLGTGELPGRESKRVIELLETLLESGIVVETAMEMVKSSMLFSSQHERYVTLDCLLIDLYTGIGKMLKLGSAESFIIREQSVEMIAGNHPPVGACFDEKTVFIRKKLNHGDIVVMVSDGVLDEFGGSVAFSSFLMKQKETCPQLLCDQIMDQITQRRDDCTVLAVGIWNK